MDQSIIGVSIELSQRSPFFRATDGESAQNSNYYKLISHFDEMKIRLVDTITDFMKENGNGDLISHNNLLTSPGETRKLFFYCADGEFGSIQSQKTYLCPELKEFKEKPFVALVGIKLCRSFFINQRANRKCENGKYTNTCDTFGCIKKILEKTSNYHPITDYCMLRCLGPEDMYILCRSSNIESILTAVHNLRAFRCCIKNEGMNCGGKNENMPIVLETHTHIGFWAGLRKEDILVPGINFEFELQVRQYAGAKTEEIVNFLNSRNLTNIKKTVGRYGLVASGSIDLEKLLEIYSHEALDWRHPDHHKHQVNYTTGRFFIDNKVGSECELGSLEDSYKAGKKALTGINDEFQSFLSTFNSRYMTRGNSLSLNSIQYNTIKEFVFTCMMGCQRLFRTYYWGEFRDVLHFFRHFLEHLQIEANEIDERCQINMEDGRNYLYQVVQSIDIFSQNMSTVLNDRLMLGRPMQENARQSVYATGAYEDLIQFYRIFIRELRQLYNKVVDTDTEKVFDRRDLHFLFVPTPQRTVRTMDLFPLNNKRDNNNRLQIICFFYMGASDLWNFRDSMIVLCHEVGHYLFQYNKKDMLTVFVKMVSQYFTSELVTLLSNVQYPSAPEEIVAEKAQSLCNEMMLFLLKHFTQEEVDNKGLDNYSFIVTDRFLRAITNQFSDTINPNNYRLRNVRIDIDGGELFQKILRVYDAFDLLPMVSMTSFGFYAIMERIIGDACSFCNKLLSECKADLFAISVLNLDLLSYAKCMLTCQNIEDSNMFEKSELKISEPITALRFINATLYLYLRDMRESELRTVYDGEKDIDFGNFYVYMSDALEKIYETYRTEEFIGIIHAINSIIYEKSDYKRWKLLWYNLSFDGFLLDYLIKAERGLNVCFTATAEDTIESPSCHRRVQDLRNVFQNSIDLTNPQNMNMLEPLMKYLHDNIPYNNETGQ